MPVTEHFEYEEMVRSKIAETHGMNNTPGLPLLPALKFTAAGMERVRACLGHPIQVTSWYRSQRVNEKAGGAVGSQHTKGEAVDFVCPEFGTPEQVYHKLLSMIKILGIDQLILEPSWVHVSFTHLPRYSAFVRT